MVDCKHASNLGFFCDTLLERKRLLNFILFYFIFLGINPQGQMGEEKTGRFGILGRKLMKIIDSLFMKLILTRSRKMSKQNKTI